MSAKDIRNIVLLGHSGSGKTTLAESMLYLTGGTDRLGTSSTLILQLSYSTGATAREMEIWRRISSGS